MRASWLMLIAGVAAAMIAFGSPAMAGKHGAGQAKACKPGQTFDQCYEKCLSRYGAASAKEYGHCSNKCGKRDCPS